MILFLFNALASPLLTLQDQTEQLTKPDMLINGSGPFLLEAVEGTPHLWKLQLENDASQIRLQLNDGDKSYEELELMTPANQELNLIFKNNRLLAETTSLLFSASTADLPTIESKEQLELSIESSSGWLLEFEKKQYPFTENKVTIGLDRKEFHRFLLVNKSDPLKNIEFSVQMPASGGAQLALLVTEDSLKKSGQQSSSSNDGGAPDSTKTETDPQEQRADQIQLKIALNNQKGSPLSAPILKMQSSGEEWSSFTLKDDGSGGDQQANDELWFLSQAIDKGEQLAVQLWDEEEQQGEITIFMPSSSEGLIELFRDERGKLTSKASGEPEYYIDNLEALTERDKNLIPFLGAIFFFSTLLFQFWRRWTRDLLPLISQLEDFLDQQEREEPSSLKDELHKEEL
jgi:hypothetical protein